MIPEPMPSSFILKNAQLSLTELRWALENGLIGAQNVVDAAAWMLADGQDSEFLVQLAGVTHAELPDVTRMLSCVAMPERDTDAKRKWTWLTLLWVYERCRDDERVADILGELYADLGYPEEMVSFGPYAPAYEGKRQPATVRQEILVEWRKYLKQGEELFGRNEERRE